LFRAGYATDILDFIRFEKTVVTSLIGIFGYVLFNPLGAGILFAALSSFCAIAVSRAYNNLKDKEEDIVNRKKINRLTEKRTGLLVILFIFIVGLFSSLYLPPISTFFYLLTIIVVIIYSALRLKSYFLVKNIVSGIFLTAVFLMGTGFLSAEVGVYYLMIFLFIYTGSLISDLMDYGGDRAAGLRTIPVVLGIGRTKRLVYALFLLFTLITFQLRLFNLFILALASIMAILFIMANKEAYVHKLGGFSVALTIIIMLI